MTTTLPDAAPRTMRARLVRLVLSWLAVGVGIPLILRAELGASPFDVLNTGVSDTTGLSFGTSFVVDSVIFFAAGRLMGARLGWACLAGTLAIGPLVNLGLDLLPEQQRLAVRVPLLVVGIAVIAVAICLVIPTELGPGPTEVLTPGGCGWCPPDGSATGCRWWWARCSVVRSGWAPCCGCCAWAPS
jgi:uncharacterized membrane protein YczE